LVDVKPHEGVARAGTAVNATRATSDGAMRSGTFILLNWNNGFMVLPFFFPRCIISAIAGPEETKNPAGKMSSA
jgi:hypothetical protein